MFVVAARIKWKKIRNSRPINKPVNARSRPSIMPHAPVILISPPPIPPIVRPASSKGTAINMPIIRVGSGGIRLIAANIMLMESGIILDLISKNAAISRRVMKHKFGNKPIVCRKYSIDIVDYSLKQQKESYFHVYPP